MSKADTQHRIAHDIGELCIGGDWACAHGDVSGLRDIAGQLADYAAEPLHCQLRSLAELCRFDPDRATALWAGLRDRVYRSCEP